MHLFVAICFSNSVEQDTYTGGFARHLHMCYRAFVLFVTICCLMPVEQDAREDSCVICFVVHVFGFFTFHFLCLVAMCFFISVEQDAWGDSCVICVVVLSFC